MSGEEKVAVTVGGEAMGSVSGGSKPEVRVYAGASNLGGCSGGMPGEAARDRGGDLLLETQDAERREDSSRHPRRWLEAPGQAVEVGAPLWGSVKRGDTHILPSAQDRLAAGLVSCRYQKGGCCCHVPRATRLHSSWDPWLGK